MTRKQAILALLATPAALVAEAPPIASSESHSTTLPTEKEHRLLNRGIPVDWIKARPATLKVELQDKDTESFGVCEITVSYHGKTKTISAKEIWDALEVKG